MIKKNRKLNANLPGRAGFLVAGLALLCLVAQPADSRMIDIFDGVLSDWDEDAAPEEWEMNFHFIHNLGVVKRDVQAEGEYEWLDGIGDERKDFADPDPQVDFWDFRITGDRDALYFMARFNDIVVDTGNGAPMIIMAIDVDRAPGSGQPYFGTFGLPSENVQTDTFLPPESAWEFLVTTRFGSGNPDLRVYNANTLFPPMLAGMAVINAGGDTIEGMLPWGALGFDGVPNVPLRFTVGTVHATDADDSWDIGGPGTSDILDAVTNYGDPGAMANTWTEVADQVLDYHWDVYFGGTGDVYSPILITEVQYDPTGPEPEAEYIEVVNVYAENIDLAGYAVGDANALDSGVEGMESFTSGTAVPGMPVVVANQADTYQAEYGSPPDFSIQANGIAVPVLTQYGAWATGSVSLDEANGDQVLLVDPFDTVIDIAVFEFGNPGDGWSGMNGANIRTTPGYPLVRNDRRDTDCMFLDFADLVINEIDYDQPSTDTAEFIEIFNPTEATSVDLRFYFIVMINGTGGGAAEYQSVMLPDTLLGPGDYFVLCANADTVPNCDLDVSPDTNLIQNGAPDAVALLRDPADPQGDFLIIDTVSYEGDTGAPWTETSGVGLEDAAGAVMSISRIPDGLDTDVNNTDFQQACVTPGEANSRTSCTCGDGGVDAWETCDPSAADNDCCNDSCDGYLSAETVCRTASLICDAAENCPGDGAACPVDGAQGTGFECRAQDGDCDVAENCNGTDKTCPGDEYAADTVQCRGADGDCDVAESCPGDGPDGPTDGYAADTVECRAQDGDCDVAESCPGDGPDCPSDGYSADTIECRAQDGDCDVAESCPGDGPDCPDDGVQDTDYECRASAGGCDIPENCDGVLTACPDDVIRNGDYECRAADGFCNPAESCDGESTDCPADDPTEMNGEECDDEIEWTEEDACLDGECVGTEVGDCDSPIEIDALPFSYTNSTEGRDSHLTDYGSDCAGESKPSPDAVYVLTVEAGLTYEITLEPGAGFNAALVILDDCGEEIDCLEAADDAGDGEAETVTFTATEDGNIYIIVEGSGDGEEGDYDLSVDEITVVEEDEVEVVEAVEEAVEVEETRPEASDAAEADDVADAT
ncbi:MAG: lamin tail domain-containing protein, partial [Pseudomonadota bacterium]